MNKLIRTFLSLCVLLLLTGINSPKASAQGRVVSLQVFYDELSPYGDWVNHPTYGYVWRPNAGPDFRPYYTGGRWVMTEYGNTWVSDYNWGWAPFHYGRWFYDDYDGWVWIPDTQWGPAWVDWRSGGGYYGWAPLAPGISININIGPRYYPDFYWVFIPQRCFYYPNYQSYWYPRRNVTIIQHTTIINNVYVDRNNRNVRYYSGPAISDVRRATRQNVPVYRIANSDRPGTSRVERGTVNVYRPSVERGQNNSPRVISNSSSRPSGSQVSNSGGVNSQRPDRGTVAERQNTAVGRGNSNNSNGSSPNRSSSERPASQPSAPQRIERSNSSSRQDVPVRSERPSSSRVERSAPAQRSESSSSSRSQDNSRSSGSSSRPSRSGR